MSHCPFAARALQQLVPVLINQLSRGGAATTLKLDFIGTGADDQSFQSLHGPTEVTGDRLYLCLQDMTEQSKFLRAVHCLSSNPSRVGNAEWAETCFAHAGIADLKQKEILECADDGPTASIAMLSETFAIATELRLELKALRVDVERRRAARDAERKQLLRKLDTERSRRWEQTLALGLLLVACVLLIATSVSSTLEPPRSPAAVLGAQVPPVPPAMDLLAGRPPRPKVLVDDTLDYLGELDLPETSPHGHRLGRLQRESAPRGGSDDGGVSHRARNYAEQLLSEEGLPGDPYAYDEPHHDSDEPRYDSDEPRYDSEPVNLDATPETEGVEEEEEGEVSESVQRRMRMEEEKEEEAAQLQAEAMAVVQEGDQAAAVRVLFNFPTILGDFPFILGSHFRWKMAQDEADADAAAVSSAATVAACASSPCRNGGSCGAPPPPASKGSLDTWRFVEGRKGCPPGMEPARPVDIGDDVSGAAGLLCEWCIAALGDGHRLSGRGYGGKVEKETGVSPQVIRRCSLFPGWYLDRLECGCRTRLETTSANQRKRPPLCPRTDRATPASVPRAGLERTAKQTWM
jgi:hypothetical protein